MPKISSYPAAGAVQDTDEFVNARSGQNFSVQGSDIGGGSSFTFSNISPTISNVTAEVNYFYNADISGLTANRNFVVPSGSEGDEIILKITTGDDTYALIIIGDAGVDIDGVGAATEWSRLFIDNEVIKLTCSAANTWKVEIDGRIPCRAEIQNTDSETIATATTVALELDESVADNANIGDTTNDRINIRRSNDYIFWGSCRYDALTANAARWQLWLSDDAAVVCGIDSIEGSAGLTIGVVISAKVNMTVGDWMDLRTWHNTGGNEATNVASGNRVFLSAMEVLPS